MRHIIHSSLLVALSVIISACTESGHSEISKRPSIEEPNAPHFLRKVTILFTDSTVTKARLFAGRARVYYDRQETVIDSAVRVLFYSSDGTTQAAHLTSDTARIDDRTQNMKVWGNVDVKSDSTHNRLLTSELEWNNSLGQIHTTAPVRIETPTEIIDGVGLVSDRFLKNYTIFKVTGVHRP